MGNSKSSRQHGEEQREAIGHLYKKHGGNVSAIAREIGLTRATVNGHIKLLGLDKKPMVGGVKEAIQTQKFTLPGKGLIKRYIISSAQNNTRVNAAFWLNLTVMALHYDAEILIGTFSYNKNAYGRMSVKKGTEDWQDELWYDEKIRPFICDKRTQLAPGLVWCGEMNILPTAEDPLSGLETYSHRQSAIFPHVKLAMRSIATMQGEGAKLNYTTGTVTERNYIQKKAGLKAEHHHRYSFLLVEVDSEGSWWVRQVGTSSDGKGQIQDLNVVVEDGNLSTHGTLEAITFGDIHATIIDKAAMKASLQMRDAMKPKFQFLHDVMEGMSFSHHNFKNPHAKYRAYLRGLLSVEAELEKTARILQEYATKDTETMVVFSNHDEPWLMRWLREHDYRHDPLNAEFFLMAQLSVYQSMRASHEKDEYGFKLIEWALTQGTALPGIRFLAEDESFRICKGKIECGMHGHLGADGAKGNPRQLAKVGRRANTAHTHSAGIWNGLYVCGTTSQLKMEYNHGPSSWTHSHTFTYPNGQRSIVTMWKGKWRAAK